MERSKGSPQGKDTFLSRVFGLHSEDVTTSVHTEEMSNFPGQPDIRQSEHQITAIQDSGGSEGSTENEEVRVPESDQGTTTDEEYSHTADIDLNEDVTTRRYDGGNDNRPLLNEESMLKVGQLSSDEEYREDIESEDEDDEDEPESDSISGDRPLFSKKSLVGSKQKVSKSENTDATSNLPHSMLFQRILQHNRQKQKKEQLFTSSKNTHEGHGLPGGNHDQWDLENGPKDKDKKRFMSHEEGSSKREGMAGKFPLRRPNIFKNAAVLNNTPANRVNTLSPKERALWKWANVDNLDVFLQEVYKYYLGNGFFCILLEKILNLATLVFVVFTSTYMGYCVDYSKLSTSTRLSEVTIDQCYSTNVTGSIRVLLWIFYIFVLLKAVQLYFDVQTLRDIHNFYCHLLNISDKELQTIPWQNIIQQIMYLKDQNALTANVVEVKAKNRIDAHDVANRIMRKENYLVAMYNNQVLDLSLPIPFYRTSILTKTLEWNINLCIMGYAFNEAGLVKQSFLKPSQHEVVKEELRKRFFLAGFLNIILSPLLVTYFVLLYFLRYFNEYKTTPGALGARQYTLMAEWKFREYNELYHLFQKRMGLSTELANKYIDQFPKEGTNLVLKFVAFISGSFVAILAILTVFDPENFLNFEISHERTVLFYITLLGAIWTICKSSISDAYNVFDPEETLKELAGFTHYLPKEWEGRYHTEEVKNEFCKFYNLRIVILIRELASLVVTPFILWFSLPRCADRIVEFFRETSVYVDGLGYLCKYAMFDINDVFANGADKSKRRTFSQPRDGTNGQSFHTRDISMDVPSDTNDSDREDEDMAIDKMMQSYMYFMDDYENSDKVVGKRQLPRRLNGENTKKSSHLNNSYSWKKQFRPGQKPELFRIGKHSLETRDSVVKDKNKSDAYTKKQHNVNRRLSADLNMNLGESFIGSVPVEQYELQVNPGIEKNSHNGGGVLQLVKEFYNQSDVGR